MRIYLLLFIYVFLSWLFVRSKSLVGLKSKRFNDISLIAAIFYFIIPVIIIGLRSSVNDTASYITMFETFKDSFHNIISTGRWDHGITWNIYMWFIKNFIKNDVNVFFMITAIIQAGAFIKLYRKYSNDYGYSILLFFLSMSFLNMMGGIRQQMAASIVLYFVDWLFEGKNIKFVIVVLFATTIHFSAIIWLPVILAIQGRAFGFRTIILGITLIVIIVYLERFTNMLSDALVATSYQGYTEQFANDDGANVVHALIAAVPIVMAFIGKQYIDLLKDKRVHMLINIAFVNLLINILATFTSGILIGRLPMFFEAFSYALIPILINTIFEYKSEQMVRLIGGSLYLAYALYYILNMGLTYSSAVLHIG